MECKVCGGDSWENHFSCQRLLRNVGLLSLLFAALWVGSVGLAARWAQEVSAPRPGFVAETTLDGILCLTDTVCAGDLLVNGDLTVTGDLTVGGTLRANAAEKPWMITHVNGKKLPRPRRLDGLGSAEKTTSSLETVMGRKIYRTMAGPGDEPRIVATIAEK